jgi:predicted nucleic acid-binding protein
VIALDSSILVGIIRGERDVQQLLPVLDGEACAIDAPTLVEARLWCSVNLTRRASDWLEHLIEGGPGTIVPFD